jgi:hypothetical protein
MGKIVLIISFLSMSVFAQERQVKNSTLESSCLACHKEQQIPSSLIYKRYLMKYSTNGRMEEAMFKYLKDPNKVNSIMPAPFFLKFPMKETLSLDDAVLHDNIQSYLEKYSMKKRLMLED